MSFLSGERLPVHRAEDPCQDSPLPPPPPSPSPSVFLVSVNQVTGMVSLGVCTLLAQGWRCGNPWRCGSSLYSLVASQHCLRIRPPEPSSPPPPSPPPLPLLTLAPAVHARRKIFQHRGKFTLHLFGGHSAGQRTVSRRVFH